MVEFAVILFICGCIGALINSASNSEYDRYRKSRKPKLIPPDAFKNSTYSWCDDETTVDTNDNTKSTVVKSRGRLFEFDQPSTEKDTVIITDRTVENTPMRNGIPFIDDIDLPF